MNRFIDRFAEKPATKLATEYVGKIIAERNRLLANVSNNEKSFFGPIDGHNDYEYIVQIVNGVQTAQVKPKKVITDIHAAGLFEWLKEGHGKPSEYFLQKMSWIFGPIILPRYKDCFLWAIDNCNKWPYERGWNRRSYRSSSIFMYAGVMKEIASAFEQQMPIDADICDILERKLPQDALEFTQTVQPGYSSYSIAYELEQGNKRLENILIDAMTGDNRNVRLNQAMIRGIVRSSNSRMHEQLCRLLLASGSQEGLRQSICECADEGTAEAFMMILNTIIENKLIRFSSVKRAVGTWLGLISDDAPKLERISDKSVFLAKECLDDPAARERYLASEDSMQIYIALWSIAFYNLEEAIQSAQSLCEHGTHHQILTSCYFADQMNNDVLAHHFAKFCIENYPDRMDVLAMCMPNFVPNAWTIANTYVLNQERADYSAYFNDRAEIEKFYNLMVRLFNEAPKKAIEFSPCVFPWHVAKLSRANLADAVCILAIMLEDEDKIDFACTLLSSCTSYHRSMYFSALTRNAKTPVQLRAVFSALVDKESSTQSRAFSVANRLPAEALDIAQLEEMLRFKSVTSRSNIIKLLLKQNPSDILASIERLISDRLEDRRCAAYDLMMAVLKDEKCQNIHSACGTIVKDKTAASAKERILLESVQSMVSDAPEAQVESLFTDEDAYVPDLSFVADDPSYLETFRRYFPDNHIADIMTGNIPDQSNAPICPSCLQAQKDLDSLHEVIAAHSGDAYQSNGEPSLLGYDPIFQYLALDREHRPVPMPELWDEWYCCHGLTPERLLRAFIRIAAFTPSESKAWKTAPIIDAFYGCGFAEDNPYLHKVTMFAVLEHLFIQHVPTADALALAYVIGYCYAKHIPEEYILVQNNRYEVTVRTIACHAQLCILLSAISYKDDESLARSFASGTAVLSRYHDALKKQFIQQGITDVDAVRNSAWAIECMWASKRLERVQMLLAEPSICDCLFAHRQGILTDKALLHFAMSPARLGAALNMLSMLSACYHSGSGQPDLRDDEYGWRVKNAVDLLHTKLGITDVNSEDAQSLLAKAEEVYLTILKVVLDDELSRGDSVSTYSYAVKNINKIYGCDYLGRILAALGKDTLVRGISWYNASTDRKYSLSHLLYVCAPSADDTVQDIARIVKEYSIPQKRLIETAMYAPEWVDLIEEYLQIPGFKSAVYYFMAHMNEQFDARRTAIIAKYTPLTTDDLNAGAFDVEWFNSAYGMLGEAQFKLLYDAAKYISDGAKHSRARKYADASLGLMDVAETEAQIMDKRNKDSVMAYALIPVRSEDEIVHRYLFLQEFLRQSKQHGAQRIASERKAVEIAMTNLATNAGYTDVTRLTLRMEAKLAEDNRDLFQPKAVDDIVVQLQVSVTGGVEIICTKDGKPLKSIPARLKKDAYIVRLTEAKKALTEQYRRTRTLFEESMEESTVFTAEEIQILESNPVVRPILEALVFMNGDRFGFVHDSQLIDANGEIAELAPADKLIVAHPFHLFKAKVWTAYQRCLFDRQLVQPFRQVFRELYVKTADELGRSNSLRYSGHQILPKKTAAVLRSRRWIADYENGLQKIYYKENIVATIYAMADWFTPADIEAPTLEWVAFYNRKTGRELKIDDIPDIIFSEIMRDVDLAVSVAHAGSYDPETSHSTIEMRAALLEFTLPMFKLSNVRISQNKAVIDGKLASYSVHLGSGVIHQLGGTMINVVPVHSQHRGRIFLPFADEDPKTSEILSKVLLFAEDMRIKDPSILEQIQ